MSVIGADRLSTLEEMAALAAQMVDEEVPALVTTQWQRLLLGKLTELLLDDGGRLTGAELRQLLGMERKVVGGKVSGKVGKLPPRFSEVVRQVYGVNLQTDTAGPGRARTTANDATADVDGKPTEPSDDEWMPADR